MDYEAIEEQMEKPMEQRRKDPKLYLFLLQVILCVAVLLTAFLIKQFGGKFYTSLREWYTARFEDTTMVDEVLASAGKQAAPAQSTAVQQQEKEGQSSPQSPAQEDHDDPDALDSNNVTAYIFDFDTVKSQMNMAGASGNSLLWPVLGTITSSFGYRNDPFTGAYGMHSGLDIAAATGTGIQAAAAGKVTLAKSSDSYGLYMIVDHQNGFETLYAHCSALYVEAGQSVKKGEVIAAVGSTGRATGPHCHFEIRIDGRRINPLWLLSVPAAV